MRKSILYTSFNTKLNNYLLDNPLPNERFILLNCLVTDHLEFIGGTNGLSNCIYAMNDKLDTYSITREGRSLIKPPDIKLYNYLNSNWHNLVKIFNECVKFSK